MEILRANNLSRYFGTVPALVDVNLELQPGEVLGIVGQRGAGKSTLFNLLSGATIPSSGEIIYAGQRVILRNVLHDVRRVDLFAGSVFKSTKFPNVADIVHAVERLCVEDFPARFGLLSANVQLE